MDQLTAQVLHIDSILYTGNKKTQNYIIRRELDFKVGDSIESTTLSVMFLRNRSRLLNTGLFKEVALNIKSWDTESNHISIEIKVQEVWYIYPIPIFELADRNFNVWWDEFNGSLSRVNYGIRFTHNNLTGQQDALKLTAQFGYSTKLEMNYSWPFFGKDRAWRFTTEALYSKNKESYFNTLEDKLVFYKSEEDYPLQRFRLATSLQHRTTLQLFQSLRLEYVYNQTSDQISKVLNPNFFLPNQNKQQFIAVRYEFKYDDRDLKYYPSKGRAAEIVILKEGLGNNSDVNSLTASFQIDQYIPWNTRHNAGFLIKAKGSIIRDQIPYYNSRALGYGENYLKGYEYYVVDGMDFIFLKFRERFIFYDRTFSLLPEKKLGIRALPLKLSVAANASSGYVNNVFYAETNPLSNRWLYSSGMSLEGLFSNTSLIQLDWSINHRKESGFYLHFKKEF
ncbi:MAG: BamA/TamA family outer membrane protein [Saprospiraceae bacterium]|nr:BamA/TamA family outer membrane protein [Saprospiraceae bacterium]